MKFSLFTVFDNYQKQGKIKRAPEQFLEEVVEQSVLADELGYESVWFAEHHFNEYGILSAPKLLLASIAQKTKNIRLGAAVVVLPFHNPILVAEDYALLDVLSNGRVNLGLGSGYLPHEFAGFKLDGKDKVHRFNEGLSIIEKAWTGETFTHEGEYYQYGEINIQVQPKQNPIPIWIAALHPESVKFVGKMGYNVMGLPYVAGNSIADIKVILDNYRQAYKEAGHDEGKIHTPLALHAYVAETREQAVEDAKEHLNLYLDTRLYGKSAKFEDLEAREQLLIGSPEDVIKRLKEYQEVGCNEVMMLMNFGGMPHEKVLKSIELTARQVMPAFRK